MSESLPARVASLARLRPQEPAVISLDATGVRIWDWARLWREAQRITAVLAGCGVRRGEVVAWQMGNRAEFVALTIGTVAAGAVCCPLMPIFRERELADMLARARVRVLFVMDGYHGRRPPQEVAAIESQVASLRSVLVLAADDPERSGGALPRGGRANYLWLGSAPAHREAGAHGGASPQADPAALAQLLFTSGTTGEPKGVLHRADVLTRAVRLQADHLGLDAADRLFVPSPLAHQTGFLYGMWLALTLGAPQILQESWEGRSALAALERWRATFVQAATPFLADLVHAAEDGAAAPRRLRLFVATGTTVPRALAVRARSVLDAHVCGAFGTTEGCLATLGSPADAPEKACGTDGRPLAGVEVRTCDEAGRPLPAGREGQLQTRSPTMFHGYLDRPDWTADAYTGDGWYRTGDLAVIDAEGYLRLTGRVKDVVNRGGEKIPVVEIEQLLHEHEAVREVAIVGMPDVRLGERACAFIVMRQPALRSAEEDPPGRDGMTGRLDLNTVRAFLDARRVAKQYWPERVEIVEALPRTPSGKVRKYLLRERASRLGTGSGAHDGR